jgi:hypothetical protein
MECDIGLGWAPDLPSLREPVGSASMAILASAHELYVEREDELLSEADRCECEREHGHGSETFVK